MRTYFDIKTLKIRLKEFYLITHIRITVFDADFNEIAGYPDSRSELCNYIRSSEKGNTACIRCDHDACQTAAKMREPYVYRCHAGLKEIISPLVIGGIVVGYLFFAHLLSYDTKQEGIDAIIKNCLSYGVEPSVMKTLIESMPLVDKDYITAASHMLSAVATQLCMERIANLKQDEFPMRIEAYVNGNMSSRLTAKELCEEFNIGKTALNLRCKEIFGESPAEHIRNRRLDKASEMLIQSPKVSVAEVASVCGFDDYCYFIALFKKKTGLSPLKFRKAKSAQ